jgi:hypothetical protein
MNGTWGGRESPANRERFLLLKMRGRAASAHSVSPLQCFSEPPPPLSQTSTGSGPHDVSPVVSEGVGAPLLLDASHAAVEHFVREVQSRE